MTTAHRPTWYNAIGGDNQGGNRKVTQTTKVCSRDLPGHMEMKLRDLSDYIDDKNTMKENLNKLENNDVEKKILAIQNIKKVTNQEYVNPFPQDEDDIVEDDFKSVRKKKRKKSQMKNVQRKTKRQKNTKENQNEKHHSKWDIADENRNQIDSKDSEEELEGSEENNDTYNSSSNSDSSSNSSSSSSSSEEETDEEERELMRELENLKKEKMERLKKEKEEEEKLKHISNNVLTNNPLVNLADSDDENGENKLKKRKWTDDAIFRNTCEKKEKTQTFINDTVRSAFHKKFLLKYIH